MSQARDTANQVVVKSQMTIITETKIIQAKKLIIKLKGTVIHPFQKTFSERTANGSCRTEIARPKGTVVSIFGMQNQ